MKGLTRNHRLGQLALWLSCLPIAIAGCGEATVLPALDTEYGFHNIRFETDTSKVSGLVPFPWQSVTDDVVPHGIDSFTYLRPSDSLTVQGYPVTRIAYTFYKGQLSCVFVTVKGQTTLANIVKAFQAKYGPGSSPWGLTENERLWIGRQVELDTRYYDGGLPEYYVPQKEIYTFTIASLVVRSRIEKDEKRIMAADSTVELSRSK